MMIPYGTDAPIYYWPFATCGMIVLNTGLFALAVASPEAVEPWTLALGDGLHPLQWLSHNFLHASIMHLIGNMIFLWAYGIIVEGKVGPWIYMLWYCLIGTIHGALVQICCLGLDNPTVALGASAIIFGLMAMCVVWAPKNTISCFVAFGGWFRFYTGTWEIPVLVFALIQIGWEVVDLFLRHLTGVRFISSAALHMSGAIIGLVVGAVMVKARFVNCEGWDLFSVMGGTSGRSGGGKSSQKIRNAPKSSAIRKQMAQADQLKVKVARKGEPEAAKNSFEERSVSAIDRINRKLDENQIDEALRIYDKTARTVPSWPTEREAIELIKALHSRNLRIESIPIMRDYCRNYPASADRMHLKLGQILIRDKEHPTHGLRVLQEIPKTALTPNLESIRMSLIAQAEQMLEEGVLELEGEY